MGIESYDYTVYYVYNESCEVIGFKYKYLDYANYPNWVTENYSYVKNLQGDIVGIINDATGEQVVSYTYDAWGNITSTTGTLASTIGQYNSMRYRGYYYDTETGMYYLQSRYYNPEMRRFINADDPELLQFLSSNSVMGGNIFAYCINEPVNNIDNNGKWIATAIKILIGALLGAATYFITLFIDIYVLKDTKAKFNGWQLLLSIGAGALGGLLSGVNISKFVSALITFFIEFGTTMLSNNFKYEYLVEAVICGTMAAVIDLLLSGSNSLNNKTLKKYSKKFVSSLKKNNWKILKNGISSFYKKTVKYFKEYISNSVLCSIFGITNQSITKRTLRQIKYGK